MTAVGRVDRIQAGMARRGASLIREAAYAAAVLRVVTGQATYQEADALFGGRHRFTPGWATRGTVSQGLTMIREAAQGAQEAQEAEAGTRAALRVQGHWTAQ